MTTHLEIAQSICEQARLSASDLTDSGKKIDEYQVLAQAVAYASTEVRAAQATQAVSYQDALAKSVADATVAYLCRSALERLSHFQRELNLDAHTIAQGALEAAHHLSIESISSMGTQIIESGSEVPFPLDDLMVQIRDSVRSFAQKEVAPLAEKIHRHDELVPEALISQIAELGYFGLSIPEEYDGHEMGNLAMILTTEELSRVSLAGAGSLITRPEILAKALLAGGTQEQKQHWLPQIAAGEKMVAISVTEPNVGSDVASLACKATPTEGGWLINGAKSWCTFAGRANIIALLARTDPDTTKGAKGLSLFIVEKDVFTGHEFEMRQPGGGVMRGTADATIGYRGMHSFTLQLEDYFVPAENQIGGAEQLGRGFYLQMAGFAAGRLQTGGRACGVAQAALDQAVRYVQDRSQFGKPIGQYQLTQFEIGQMAMQLCGARAITYEAALAMDEDERKAAPLAAQAKLFACDVAVAITQKSQLLHGGWGYAEEYPISRYVVDALVLPIFEGVKPVLELKVVARSLLK